MSANAKAKPAVESDDPATELLASLELRDDEGGWVTSLHDRLVHADVPLRQRWHELLNIVREARPRSGKPWKAAQDDADALCSFPPTEYDDEPRPEPGSDAYHEALRAAAPSDAWLERVREIV